eukprot:COSAG01_NODE_144_length_24108_cov_11.490441_32_plen_430_part_00
MASCLAAIATGMSSCFVYLQHDSPAMRTLSVSASQHFEVHGQAAGAAAQLTLHADWSVAGSSSLLLGTLQLGGGAGSGGTHLTVATGGQLTLQTVTMARGTVAFSGSVAVTGSTWTSAHLSGTSGQLSLAGGTLAGSTIQLTGGTATFGGSCVLTNTPVSVSGAASAPQALLGVSHCELRSDGTAVPLVVGAAAMATVTQTTFRSTAGSITAVSVVAGGNLTVSASQLVRADGHTDPFPCDGTLPRCAGAHAGSVEVGGPTAVTMAAPLVCDAASGRCLADLCVADHVSCGASVNTCVPTTGTCRCAALWSGARCDIGHCPAGATQASPSDRYCSDLVGTCAGPGRSSDLVNAKYKRGVSRPACQAGCDANPACVGYSYAADDGHCRVLGPGLDTDLGGGWGAYTHPATTIGGTVGWSGYVCAAVAGRN